MNTILLCPLNSLIFCATLSITLASLAGDAFIVPDNWDADANAKDLAIFPWGNPQFTDDLQNTHPRPAWVLAACMDGGLWITNDTWYGWQPALGDWHPDLSTNRLLIQFDRTLASNTLWIAVAASGDPEAVLLAGFYDSDLLSVIDPVTLHITEPPLWRTNAVDLSQIPTATILSLFTTNGLLRIFNTTLVQMPSGGTTAPPSATQCTDNQPVATPTPADRPTVRPSSVLRSLTSATTTTWYVNATAGSDTYDGTAAACIPSTTTGPRQTITAVLADAAPGDTINVAAGVYAKTVKLANVRLVTTGRVVLQ